MNKQLSIQQLKELLVQEKNIYEHNKVKFYSDPAHWSNNKRRMHGLHTLRGESNKDRKTRYQPYRPSYKLFDAVYAFLQLKCNQAIENCFRDFANVKDIVQYLDEEST